MVRKVNPALTGSLPAFPVGCALRTDQLNYGDYRYTSEGLLKLVHGHVFYASELSSVSARWMECTLDAFNSQHT